MSDWVKNCFTNPPLNPPVNERQYKTELLGTWDVEPEAPAQPVVVPGGRGWSGSTPALQMFAYAQLSGGMRGGKSDRQHILRAHLEDAAVLAKPEQVQITMNELAALWRPRPSDED